MNKINRLLVITLVMGLMVVSAMHNDVLAQRDRGKVKVLERSKRFPRWAKMGLGGKIFKQKHGSKKFKPCSKRGTVYLFINTFEYQINRKHESTGKPFNASRQDAERFADVDMSDRLDDFIGIEVTNKIKYTDGYAETLMEIRGKRKYTDDGVEVLTDVANAIQPKKNIQGFLRVGSAWERVLKHGNTYWIIHTLCSICKQDLDKILIDNAKAAGVSDDTNNN